MSETSKAARILEYARCTALALLPVLDIYRGIAISGSPFLNLGMTLLLALAVIEILINRGRFVINRELLLIMMFLIALNVINGFLHMGDIDIELTFNNTMYMFAAALISVYYVRTGIVERELFLKFIIAVGLVATAFILVQYILHQRGTDVFGFIPGLPLDTPLRDEWDVSITYSRPNSIFREPAHYAIYILPIFTIVLFRRKYLLSAIFLAGILISTSSTGLFVALVVLGVFVAKENRIPIIFKWILAIIGVVLLIQFMPTISESSVIEKLKFVNLAENIRVFGTLEYFKYYGVKEIILGAGHNLMAAFIDATAFEYNQGYANALLFAFFSFGLVGGTAWTWYVIRLHRLSRFKLVYLVFIFVLASDQILFNRNLFYLMLILHVFADKTDAAVLEPEGQS